MLPVKPFTSNQFKKVQSDLDRHWGELMKRERVALQYLEAAKNDKFIDTLLKETSVKQSEYDKVFKSAVILLYRCLGSLILKTLMQYQPSTVLFTACNVVVNFDFDRTDVSLANTVVVSTLCDVTLSAHASNEMHYCLNILNHLPLPYYLHQAVLSNVSTHAHDRRVTQH